MPRLAYAADCTALLQQDMPRWLILDRLPDTLQQLYMLEDAPEYVPLYANTRYAAHLDYSPLLVRANQPRSAVWRAYVEGLGVRPLRGVVVTAPCRGWPRAGSRWHGFASSASPNANIPLTAKATRAGSKRIGSSARLSNARPPMARSTISGSPS